jgi:hypothetical protein
LLNWLITIKKEIKSRDDQACQFFGVIDLKMLATNTQDQSAAKAFQQFTTNLNTLENQLAILEDDDNSSFIRISKLISLCKIEIDKLKDNRRKISEVHELQTRLL